MMMRARYQVQEWSQSSRHGDQRAVRLGSSFWLLRLLGFSCDIRPAYSSPVLWRSWLFSGWAEDYECSKELPRCVPACIQRHFHAMIYVCIRMCVCMHISVCIYIYWHTIISQSTEQTDCAWTWLAWQAWLLRGRLIREKLPACALAFAFLSLLGREVSLGPLWREMDRWGDRDR